MITLNVPQLIIAFLVGYVLYQTVWPIIQYLH